MPKLTKQDFTVMYNFGKLVSLFRFQSENITYGVLQRNSHQYQANTKTTVKQLVRVLKKHNILKDKSINKIILNKENLEAFLRYALELEGGKTLNLARLRTRINFIELDKSLYKLSKTIIIRQKKADFDNVCFRSK